MGDEESGQAGEERTARKDRFLLIGTADWRAARFKGLMYMTRKPVREDRAPGEPARQQAILKELRRAYRLSMRTGIAVIALTAVLVILGVVTLAASADLSGRSPAQLAALSHDTMPSQPDTDLASAQTRAVMPSAPVSARRQDRLSRISQPQIRTKMR